MLSTAVALNLGRRTAIHSGSDDAVGMNSGTNCRLIFLRLPRMRQAILLTHWWNAADIVGNVIAESSGSA
jgi:hypothetical protein